MTEIGNTPEKEIIAKSIGMLKSLRDDFSEEIPAEIIHSSDNDNKYKVRGSWFQGITANVESLLEFAPKDAPQIIEINALINYFCNSKDFSDKMASRTDGNDIDRGNRLICLVLEIFGES